MKIIADTNVLVRAALQEDPIQGPLAKRILEDAEQVIVSRHALCEFVWVLSRSYRFSKIEIASALVNLLNAENVVTDEVAVQAGFAALQAGADFADGVIAYEGRWLGGETFVSFDRKAVTALEEAGERAKLLR